MRDRATDTPCLPCLHPDAALEITRNDVLIRDLANVVFKNGEKQCTVLSGVLHDPYTATTINFQRGQATSSAVQIDHVISVALSSRQAIIAALRVDGM